VDSAAEEDCARVGDDGAAVVVDGAEVDGARVLDGTFVGDGDAAAEGAIILDGTAVVDDGGAVVF